MNIYFFSNHTPDLEMIRDLGSPITARFKGCISDIHSRNNQISFTETLHIGGETCQVCHTIPAESVVVTEAPLALQDAWLKAGAVTLLIPRVKQEATGWGHHVLKYDGLIQVHKIEVVTSPWLGKGTTDQDAHVGQVVEKHEQTQPSGTTGMPPAANLFQRLGWNPAKQATLH